MESCDISGNVQRLIVIQLHPLATFTPHDVLFDHVYLDLVGPLPSYGGWHGLSTCMDGVSQWPEFMAIPDISAEYVGQAFLTTWFSRYCVPLRVKVDQLRKFQYSFNNFFHLLRRHHINTTAYLQAADGIVKRFHRQLNVSLKATDPQSTRSQSLLPIMLGLRTVIKEVFCCCVAYLVSVTTLCLFEDFQSSAPKAIVPWSRGGSVAAAV